MVLIFGSLSSNDSFVKKVNALFMFYLTPCGGSLVSLILFSRRPIGMELAGSEDKKSLNPGADPSAANSSSFFSSSNKNNGIK